MRYTIDMHEMVVRSSDGHTVPIGALQNTLVSIIEPVPGASYELFDGSDCVAISSWYEFMRLLGIVV